MIEGVATVPDDWPSPDRLLTPLEAAELVYRPKGTIRRWIADGHLAPAGRRHGRKAYREKDVIDVDAETHRAVRENRTPRASVC